MVGLTFRCTGLNELKKASCANTHMMKTNDILQWTGAAAIIAMHVLNAMGPEAYPYNIIAAFVGTVAFLAWTIRVRNLPQFTVNVIALAIGFVGLYKAFG